MNQNYFKSFTTKSTSASLPKTNNSSKFEDEAKNFQVYSQYIQPDLNKQHKNNSKISYLEHDHQVKKPKLSKKPENQSPELDLDLSEKDLTESFIGINTFQSDYIFTDLINQDLIIVCLNQNLKNKFCFKGKCSLFLLHGNIKINGYDINENIQKCFDLYSPETNSYICIINNQKSTENVSLNEHYFNKILNKFYNDSNITIANNDFEKNLQEYLVRINFGSNLCSLFAIRPLKSQLCNYICYFENFQHIYLTINENENNKQTNFDYNLTKFGIYPILEQYFNAIYLENTNEKVIIEDIIKYSNEKSPVIMPCGGKDVGKSTFLRYLINSLLNSFSAVAYIDCDPGQCEFTLGSCLSLTLINEPIFGPPHTHISHSDSNKRCYFFGHLSPNDVPGVYLKYLNQCFQDFEELKSNLNKNNKIPLVINTMGWNQGLGLCLLKESILLFKPTHLIQINHPIEANKNMPLLDLNWLKNSEGWPSSKNIKNLQQTENQMDLEVSNDINLDYNLINIKSNVPNKSTKYSKQVPQKRLSPRDHRNIAIIAYFSKLNDYSTYFKSIHHARPYRISWSKLALHVSHSLVDYDQFFRIFNASLVSLSQVDNKYIRKKEENLELPGYLEISIKDSPVITCLGFGIIRGINIETKEFYILTPEPIEILNNVNLLCKGMLNLPLEFFYEQDSETPCPYMSYSEPKNDNSDMISNEPIQRKYLIHQAQNKKS